jgi:putative acetyltransferase
MIRPIRADDDPHIARIIREVMPQFGASGPGFAIHDGEVDAMHAAYSKPRCAYLVVDDDVTHSVLGGGGIAPLDGGDGSVCELKKMYFVEAARGRGLGAQLLADLIDRARGFAYDKIYLETLTGMDAAMKLYQKLGFVAGCRRGSTGHFGCDRFFERSLQ